MARPTLCDACRLNTGRCQAHETAPCWVREKIYNEGRADLAVEVVAQFIPCTGYMPGSLAAAVALGTAARKIGDIREAAIASKGAKRRHSVDDIELGQQWAEKDPSALWAAPGQAWTVLYVRRNHSAVVVELGRSTFGMRPEEQRRTVGGEVLLESWERVS